ncbi:GDSL-type esterase/lipase family protein [Streptomyces sp. NPDC059753]|uniref:GDSL-type esterase/lipase family protein n=1 Tax=Streptomyces sp. NPDC059753 TaxID=3346933 RepID=UPI00364FABB8
MAAIPPGIATVTLTGHYIRPDGTPIRGTVSFNAPALTLSEADTIAVGAATVELDETGHFSVLLIATDTPQMQPTGWAYTVTENFLHAVGRSYAIQLPTSNPVVDLADIAPADPSHGDYVLVPGPPGVAGTKILTGTGAPASGVGANGDLYIDTTSGAVTLYGPKASGAWPATGVALGGSSNLITSVNGKTGAVNLTAADVGAFPATGGALTGFVSTTLGLRANLTADNVNSLITDQPATTTSRVAIMRVGGVDKFSLNANGELTIPGFIATGGTSTFPNIKLGTGGTFGGATGGAVAVSNVTTAPTANPSGGAVLYAEGGVLKVRQSDGTTAVVGAGSGMTQAAADARYAMLTRSSRNDLGIYVPPGWGSFWRAKRDAASTGKATIAVVGGSASQGMYASNPITKSWPGAVRSSLQTTYGDGGSGFHSTSLSSTILASGDSAALAAWTTAGAIVAQTGTWVQSGNKFGPGLCGIYTETTGDTLTFSGVRGTTVKIYTVSGGTRPNFTYSIDGGSAVTVTQNTGAAAIQVTTVTGLTSGTHSVKLTCGTTTTGNYLTVVGVEGTNATGVVVNNLAMGGASSASYANNTTAQLNSTWNGGVDYPADLVIYTAGPNDATANTTGDAWAANVAKFLKAVRDTGSATGTTDVIIMLPHLGTHDTTNYKYQDFALRARSLAEVYGAAFVNMWAIGRNSWEYWRTLGYWGTSAGTGAAGTDAVHLSDAGFAFMANQVLPILTA